MKILFLNTNIGYGGASKIMVWLANKLAIEGNEVTLLTYRDGREFQSLEKDVKHVHIQLETLSGQGKGLFHTIKVLHNYLKKESFNWAIAFLSPSHLRLALACKGTQTKILFSHRGDPYHQSKKIKSIILGRIVFWAFKQADYYVFQTEKAKAFYSKKIQNKSVVIANPVVPLQRTVAREGHIEKHIVNVSRLDIHQKRQDVLIKAFIMIADRYPNYTLDLYGDGEDERTLRELAHNNSQIRFMGKTANVVEAIQNATMFVLSSDFEGIPNALIEAMSLGVPCISTDCSPGGAAMLIQNKENGLLVPCCNPQLLSEAMAFFIDNPKQCEAMGKKGIEINEKYNESRIKAAWIQTLNSN